MPCRSKSQAIAFRIAAGCLAGAAALVLCAALTRGAGAEEPWRSTPDERQERLAKLDAAEKEKLLRQKERFDNLTPEEQEKLRAIHEALANAPDGDRLYGVLKRYCEWLKMLTPADRQELANLSGESRIERIRELMKAQEERRFKRLADLSYEDAQKVLAWLDELVEPHEGELLEAISDRRVQGWLRGFDNPRVRRKKIVQHLFHERQGEKFDAITKLGDADVKRLLASLSPTMRDAFGKLDDPGQQQELVRKWIAAVVFNPAYIPVSESDLQEFFTKLPSTQQAELERLPREQMRQELRRRYLAERYFKSFNWGQGGPPFRGPRRDNRGRYGDNSDRNEEGMHRGRVGDSGRRERPSADEERFAKPSVD